MKKGDKVRFTADVLKRVLHDHKTSRMRGTVIELISNGKVARIDCGDTYANEDGSNIRSVPVANLAVIKS